MNLCIVQPRELNQRGSFIDYQIKFLSPVLEIYNGWYPSNSTSSNIFSKFPLTNLILRGIIKRLFPLQFHKFYSREVAILLVKNKISCGLIEYGPTAANLTDAFKIAGIPFAVHFHGFDAYHYKTLKQYKKKYISLFNLASAVIVVSTDMRKQIVQLGADENKVFINHYGVDTSKFEGSQVSKSEPNLIFVGRFTEKKSPSDLINAFKIAQDTIKNAKLILVGYGELLDSTKKMVSQMNLNKNVIFTGPKQHIEIIEYLKHARAFVQHSRRAKNGDSEGLPNTILEASSTGLPVISTYHAGIPEAVIHGKTGFLVEEGDSKKMAEYMIQLLQDPALAQEMGHAGQEYITSNFSLNGQLASLKKILESISL